jgi:hypothetical protein
MADGLGANPLVLAIRRGSEAEAAGFAPERMAGVPTGAENSDDLIVFMGFLDDPVARPGREEELWDRLYTDLALTDWLIVAPNGSVRHMRVRDSATPDIERDVLWVRARAMVAHGTGVVADESEFLAGDFMRAGDFEAPVGGGTNGASTGIFCEARTPTCCRYPSR